MASGPRPARAPRRPRRRRRWRGATGEQHAEHAAQHVPAARRGQAASEHEADPAVGCGRRRRRALQEHGPPCGWRPVDSARVEAVGAGEVAGELGELAAVGREDAGRVGHAAPEVGDGPEGVGRIEHQRERRRGGQTTHSGTAGGIGAAQPWPNNRMHTVRELLEHEPVPPHRRQRHGDRTRPALREADRPRER